ncbi:MAG: hypothetical protein AAB354_15560 [candidate division KSB1 bacterium]
MSEITLKEATKLLAEIRAKAKPKYSTNEMGRRGEKVYARIKAQLEPQYTDKYVAIEVDSGDYFVDKDSTKALLKARRRHPKAIFYLARIGHRAAYKMTGYAPLL